MLDTSYLGSSDFMYDSRGSVSKKKSVISVGSEALGTRTETKSQQQERAAIDNELKTREKALMD